MLEKTIEEIIRILTIFFGIALIIVPIVVIVELLGFAEYGVMTQQFINSTKTFGYVLVYFVTMIFAFKYGYKTECDRYNNLIEKELYKFKLDINEKLKSGTFNYEDEAKKLAILDINTQSFKGHLNDTNINYIFEYSCIISIIIVSIICLLTLLSTKYFVLAAIMAEILGICVYLIYQLAQKIVDKRFHIDSYGDLDSSSYEAESRVRAAKLYTLEKEYNTSKNHAYHYF